MLTKDRNAELLDDVAKKVASMAEVVLSEGQDAGEFGQRVADMLADDWGGLSVYIPKNAAARLTRRNARLFEEFDGKNIPDLARKYGISEQRVYFLLKAERERRRVRQCVLPGLSFTF